MHFMFADMDKLLEWTNKFLVYYLKYVKNFTRHNRALFVFPHLKGGYNFNATISPIY